MYDPIYAPIDQHSSLAESLAQAIHGNYSSLISSSGLEISPLDTCINGSSSEYTWGTMTYLALRCGDGDDLRNVTTNWWRGHFHRAVSNSPEMGPDLAATTMACIGWQARPKFRFTGPFGSPQADPNGRSDRPSAPVLFLSSRYDPITPLASARIASKAHSGSRVLVQNSTGHCATLASPSKCTKEFVARYMDTGELPPEDAECSGDCEPFEDCPYLRAKLSR
jgi:pimeloyl-ACP methyl ester carboxylesterase